MDRRLSEHGICFVCGRENPHGFGVQWWLRDDGTVHTRLAFRQEHQGPPGHAHGGALAAVLDEAMGAAAWAAGYKVLAGELHIRYRRTVPLGVPVTVEARVVDHQGRKVFTQGVIRLPDGQVATQAQGVFIEAPHLFPPDLPVRWQPLDDDPEAQNPSTP